MYRLDALVEDLEGVSVVLLDTSSCVYFLNETQPWLTLIRIILERGDRNLLRVLVPSIVQMELLVRSFKSDDDLDRRRVEVLVERTPFVQVVPFDRDVMLASAEIRGRFGLKLADSILVGSACVAGCDALVGNDQRFRVLQRDVQLPGKFPAPSYIHLNDYVDDVSKKA